MLDFLKQLFISGDVIEIRTITETDVKEAQSKFCTYDTVYQIQELVEKENGKKHIYFGVLPRKTSSGTDTDILALTTLWVDLDAKQVGSKDKCLNILESFKLQPSVIVDSGNGYHAYWILEKRLLLDTEENIKIAKDLLKAIHRNLQGDHTFNLSRILRLPDTINIKKEQKKCFVLRTSDFKYTLEDFYKVLDFSCLYEEETQELDFNDGSRITDNITMQLLLPDSLLQRAQELPIKYETDRSGNDFFLSVKMYEFGLNDVEIVKCFELFKDNGWKAGEKFEDRKAYLLKYTLPKAKAKAYDFNLLLNRIRVSENSIDKNALIEDFTKKLSKKSSLEQELQVNNLLKVTKNDYSKTIIKKMIKSAKEEIEYGKFFDNKIFIPELMKDFINRFYTFISVNNKLMYFQNGIFVDGEIFLRELIVKYLGNDWRARYSDEVIRIIRDSSSVNPEKLNFSNFINVKNGMLDIENGELHDHSPEYLSTIQLNVEYDPEANEQIVHKFIGEVFSSDNIPIIWEYSGYFLCQNLELKKFLILTGKGNNGKSIWLSLISEILGKQNIANEPLHKISNSNFSACNLFGKIGNINADLETIDIKNIGIIKMLTGGDIISADVKYGNTLYFVNKAKLLFSCNDLPNITDVDSSGAFFERVIIINCSAQFIHGKNADVHILDKLKTEKAKSTWLNYAMKGAQNLLKNKRFTLTENIMTAGMLYKYTNDSVTEFIANECLKDEDAFVSKRTLYDNYRQWAISTGRVPASMKTFTRRAHDSPNNLVEFNPANNGQQTASFKGLKLKNINNNFYLKSKGVKIE